MKPQDYSARTAYRPPAAWYRRTNRLGVLLTSAGLAPRDAVTLQVRGRTSGKARRVPILRTRHQGADYLVALAGESQWVRNVRAAHGHAIIRRRGARSVHLEELAPAERPKIITEYLRAARRRSGPEAGARQARYYFGLDPDPSSDDIGAIAENYPVFRVNYDALRDAPTHWRRKDGNVAHIQGEVLIRRPVEEVFDFVADERNEPTYNANMLLAEKVTEGPIGVGTRFRATIRSGGRPVGMQIEYTAFDRPRLLASTIRMAAADFSGSLTFMPTSAGTRLRWSWEAQPKGRMRLLAPVFAPIGARQERRMWTALRDHLEVGRHAETVLDRHLPAFDVRERQSRLLHADVGQVRAAIRHTDLTGIPIVRALLLLRALPGRLRARLGGSETPVVPPFTLADMPQAGWTPLAEGPEELAFGTLTHPWRLGDEAPLVVDRESFAAFSTPGYAKVAFSIRADPDGPHQTRVTTETRVATTDPRSRVRFAAYWVVVGPLSALIRRLMLRSLARHVGP